MMRAFSSMTSGLLSRFRSSHAVQNRIFSSEYSQRKKSLNTFLPARTRLECIRFFEDILKNEKEKNENKILTLHNIQD